MNLPRFFVLLPPDWRIRQQIDDCFWFISAAQLIARRGLIGSLFLLDCVWCLFWVVVLSMDFSNKPVPNGVGEGA